MYISHLRGQRINTPGTLQTITPFFASATLSRRSYPTPIRTILKKGPSEHTHRLDRDATKPNSHFQTRKQRHVLLREWHFQHVYPIDLVTNVLGDRRPWLRSGCAGRKETGLKVVELVGVGRTSCEDFPFNLIVLGQEKSERWRCRMEGTPYGVDAVSLNDCIRGHFGAFHRSCRTRSAVGYMEWEVFSHVGPRSIIPYTSKKNSVERRGQKT